MGTKRNISLLAGALLTAAALPSSAGEPPFDGVSLRVRDQTAPPGGAYQLNVELTEPKPIVIGRGLARPPLGTVMGLLLPGDPTAGAAAVIGPQGITVRAVSSDGKFGLNADAPLITITLGVPDSTPLGAKGPLALDPTGSEWVGPSGTYPQEVKNGTFTCAAGPSITDVVPGGGLLPAGSTISIVGQGFEPGASVEIDGASTSAARFIDSTRLEVTARSALQLDGRLVSVRNPSRARVRYYSYLRAKSLGESSRPLLAATEPAFPVQPLSFGAFPAAPAAPATFVAVALQNPAAADAQVTISLQSSSAGTVAQTTVSLPPRSEISRDVSELFPGIAPGSDTVVTVSASSPVQMLGLSGDEAAGAVTPLLPSVSF